MKTIVKKEFIDAAFECSHQADVTMKLYALAFPDIDRIAKVKGFPSIGKEASEYMLQMLKKPSTG